MPTFQNLGVAGNSSRAIPGNRFGAKKSICSVNFSTYNATVTGVTKDSSSVILGSCTVKIYRSSDDVELLSTVSDAVTGVYTFYNVAAGPFYVVAYKAGSPDVAGITVNTIAAT